MPVQKTPQADLRRRYPLYAEAGLVLALGVAVLAFTVPGPPAEAVTVVAETEPPIEVDVVPPTDIQEPPPPPPPAPPPPVEVPDDVEVADEIVTELPEIEFVAPPSGPPAPPVAPPVIDVAPPAPPPVVDPIPDEDPVFDVVEVEPVLVGGIGGLQSRVVYPDFAVRAGIEGRVTVQFVVDERGNVVDPVAVRCPNELLCEAAVKAVQASRFTPGQQRGRPVKVRFAVPVVFQLR